MLSRNFGGKPSSIRHLFKSYMRKNGLNSQDYYSTETYFRQWENIDDVAKNDGYAFTVMSYNILAQHYIDSQPFLYLKHNSKTMKWPYRINVLRQEIDAISPDIICLQEVQQSHLIEIASYFGNLGYNTQLYKKRSGSQIDGCAIFFKESKFDLIDHRYVDYFRPNVHVGAKE